MKSKYKRNAIISGSATLFTICLLLLPEKLIIAINESGFPLLVAWIISVLFLAGLTLYYLLKYVGQLEYKHKQSEILKSLNE
jgi:hypothetical protein